MLVVSLSEPLLYQLPYYDSIEAVALNLDWRLTKSSYLSDSVGAVRTA